MRFLILNLATGSRAYDQGPSHPCCKGRGLLPASIGIEARRPRCLRRGMHMMRIASLARPVALVALGVCLGLPPAAAESSTKDVLKNYADIAAAGYADSLATAKNLQLAVNQLLANPTDQNMLAARAAWVAARIPYMQTEAYRFGNKIVDDWEGKVNSWPLDEGLIDYVAESYGKDSPENELYAADVIANTSLTIGGKKLNTSKITKELLADTLQEAGGVEA